MTHVTVAYTNELNGCGAFIPEDFAPRLRALLAATSGVPAGPCRIRLVYPQDEWFIEDGTEETHQAVHVEVALEADPGAMVRRTLGAAVLALLRQAVGFAPEYEVHLSVEVRALDPDGYADHITPAGDAQLGKD